MKHTGSPAGTKVKSARRVEGKRAFNVQRRQTFYADMASFIAEGITPFNAMDRMREIARQRRTMKWLNRVLTSVLARMGEGAGFATALQPWVPAEEAALLMAGEKGSRLPDATRELADLLATRAALKGSLISNLAPSAGMLVVMLALMIYILNTVMKEAKGLVPPDMMDQLFLAPMYFTFGDIVMGALPFVIVFSIALVMAVSASLPRWKPSGIRMWLDHHLPPYSMYTRIQSSFILITISSMMEAGATFQQAVEDIQKHAHPWTKAHTRRMLKKLAAGRAEAEALQTGLLPWDIEDRLATYKLLSDFKVVMRATARDSMARLLKRVDLLGKAVKLLVMVLLALFIVFTIFSIGEVALEAQSSINKIKASP